jgi:hypothetical protein
MGVASTTMFADPKVNCIDDADHPRYASHHHLARLTRDGRDLRIGAPGFQQRHDRALAQAVKH